MAESESRGDIIAKMGDNRTLRLIVWPLTALCLKLRYHITKNAAKRHVGHERRPTSMGANLNDGGKPLTLCGLAALL